MLMRLSIVRYADAEWFLWLWFFGTCLGRLTAIHFLALLRESRRGDHLPEKRKMNYVVGFLFDDDGETVALIHKQRPSWQKGLLNGVGGKMEYGELASEAMIRECEEEFGVRVEDWEQFAVLTSGDSLIYFFKAFDSNTLVRVGTSVVHSYDPADPNVEVPVIIFVDTLPYYATIPNLQWLIPMALENPIYSSGNYEIKEV